MEFLNICNEMVAPFLLRHPVYSYISACDRSVPLGMMSGGIQDWQVSASSTSPAEWDKGCHERFARLYHGKGRSWCAKYKAPSEWLQVDLGVASKVFIILLDVLLHAIELVCFV